MKWHLQRNHSTLEKISIWIQQNRMKKKVPMCQWSNAASSSECDDWSDIDRDLTQIDGEINECVTESFSG